MKKYLKFSVMAVFLFVTGLNVYKAQTDVKLSDTQLKNVEALAGGEWLPEVEIVCGEKGGNCWTLSLEDCKIGWFHYGPDCVFTGSTSDFCLTPCD